MKYFIRSVNEVDDDGVFLYWNNQYGWVNKNEADVFSLEEMIEFNLPIGGCWEKIKF